MIILLVGASGTGKDSVARVLREKYGFKTVVSWTTRKPREGEIDGVNYHFIDTETFKQMLYNGAFIEYDKYSGERFYGSVESDYPLYEDSVAILTPNGVRQFTHNVSRKDYYIVYLQSPLSVKCCRYIEREKSSFNIDNLWELTRRSIADGEMFRSFEEIADLCIENNEETTIEEIADKIYDNAKFTLDLKSVLEN